MGHNPSRYTLKRLSVDAQHAVDEYKARSVWGAWWSLDEKLRRRYFTREERAFITRYGARLDEIACHRETPKNEKEQHFLRVCVGEEEPATPNERLWLLVQLVCRFQRSVDRAARADLAEHDANALRAENRALKAKINRLDVYALRLAQQLDILGSKAPPLCNIVWMTSRFQAAEVYGPRPAWRVICETHRSAPIAMLTATGISAVTH